MRASGFLYSEKLVQSNGISDIVKADAAQFISDMAFCSPIVAATPASNMPVNLLCRGTVLQEDQPESITNAEEFIECLRDQLSEAGVTDAYAEPMAAFLLSA